MARQSTMVSRICKMVSLVPNGSKELMWQREAEPKPSRAERRRFAYRMRAYNEHPGGRRRVNPVPMGKRMRRQLAKYKREAGE